MRILGIDPGSKQSGFVEWDCVKEETYIYDVVDNAVLLDMVRLLPPTHLLAIEQIRGYGIVAGDDTFDTCQWTGRFQEAHEKKGGEVIMCPRKEIKRHLCGNTTTNDKYIRMALIDRYGEPGTKRSPGKLYGISGHLWSALAVAVYAYDKAGRR